MKKLTYSFLFLIIHGLSACSQSVPEIHETRFMMGTLVSFTIIHPDQAQAKLAIKAASEDMQRIEDTFTIYGKHHNSIKQFNQSPINTPFTFSHEISDLLLLSQHIQQQSHGAFNVNLAQLNQLWGFSQEPPPQSPPDAKRIATYQQGIENCMQYKHQQWLRTSIHCQLDFGAIAKGYAIDQGINILKQHGIKNAMINAGGDIRLIGMHGKEPWHIGIRHPRHQDQIVASIDLQGDVSIVTSGDYERSFIYQGKRYHHILDPHTGYPSMGNQSTTVITQQASLADAWSTALFVLGKQAMNIAQKNHLQCLIIDANGQLEHTKNMLIHLPQAQ